MEIQWPLVLFTALAGTGAWLFVCMGINEFVGKNKPAIIYTAFVSCVLLGLGGLASATHLSHPERILNALNNPTSGIFLEASMIFILIALAVVFAILVYRDGNAIARKIIALAGIAIAVAFTYSAGESYTMSSQAMWDTPLFVIACIFAPLPAGASLWMLMLCVCHKEFELSMLLELLRKIRALFGRRKRKQAEKQAAAAAEEAEVDEALALEEGEEPDADVPEAGEAVVATADELEPEGDESEAAEPEDGEQDAPAPRELPVGINIAAIELLAGAAIALVCNIVYGVVSGAAFGEYVLFFWLLIIAVGDVVPLCLAALVLRKPDADRVTRIALVAFLGGACGAVCFRCFQWMIGGALMSLFGVVI